MNSASNAITFWRAKRPMPLSIPCLSFDRRLLDLAGCPDLRPASADHLEAPGHNQGAELALERPVREACGVRPPEVSYARSGDVAIAYQVVGTGPPDLVFVRGTTGGLVSTWEQPLLVRHVEGLAESTRVLMLDKRGTGLSDRPREVQSIETTMDDRRAVMDAARSGRAVLWTGSTSTGIGV